MRFCQAGTAELGKNGARPVIHSMYTLRHPLTTHALPQAPASWGTICPRPASPQRHTASGGSRCWRRCSADPPAPRRAARRCAACRVAHRIWTTDIGLRQRLSIWQRRRHCRSEAVSPHDRASMSDSEMLSSQAGSGAWQKWDGAKIVPIDACIRSSACPELHSG